MTIGHGRFTAAWRARLRLFGLRVRAEVDFAKACSFARLRAASASSFSAVPSVTRRCFDPMRYWAIHVRLPPSLIRRPKPGKTVIEEDSPRSIPGGSLSRWTVASVSFTDHLGSTWEAPLCRFPIAYASQYLRVVLNVNRLDNHEYPYDVQAAAGDLRLSI